MKTLKFKLDRSVRITPLSGESTVKIASTGSFEVSGLFPKIYYPKYHLLVQTLFGKCYRTTGGKHRIIKITLPTEVASKEKFTQEMFNIFKQLDLMETFGR